MLSSYALSSEDALVLRFLPQRRHQRYLGCISSGNALPVSISLHVSDAIVDLLFNVNCICLLGRRKVHAASLFNFPDSVITLPEVNKAGNKRQAITAFIDQRVGNLKSLSAFFSSVFLEVAVHAKHTSGGRIRSVLLAWGWGGMRVIWAFWHCLLWISENDYFQCWNFQFATPESVLCQRHL